MVKSLSFVDQGFLEMESRENPLHVGVVQVYDARGIDKASFVTRSLDYLSRAIAEHSPFNLKLHHGKGGQYDWVQVEKLNLDYHASRQAIENGSLKDVMKVASKLHESKMQRDYPLWQLHALEGLQDDLLALYFKVHHACMDGVAGMRLLQSFLSTDPAEQKSITGQGDENQSSAFKIPDLNIFSLFGKAEKILREEIHAVKELGMSFLKDFRSTDKSQNRLLPLPFTAPETCFNGESNNQRMLEVRSYRVDALKKVKKRLGVTVNDLVLAMCSGALRKYLEHKQSLPDMPLTAFIPVSVRSAHGSEGNELGFIIVNLATHEPDIRKRIELISASTQAGKDQLSHMSKDAIKRHTEMFFALGSVSGASSALKYLPPMFNVVISNVPAARKPLYLNGVPLKSIYPVSVLFSMQGLNITLLNYAGNLDFGLIGCSKMIPDLSVMAEFLDESFHEILQLK